MNSKPKTSRGILPDAEEMHAALQMAKLRDDANKQPPNLEEERRAVDDAIISAVLENGPEHYRALREKEDRARQAHNVSPMLLARFDKHWRELGCTPRAPWALAHYLVCERVYDLADTPNAMERLRHEAQQIGEMCQPPNIADDIIVRVALRTVEEQLAAHKGKPNDANEKGPLQ